MQVRPIKSGEVFPPPTRKSMFAEKLKGYSDVIKNIRQGSLPADGVELTLDQNEIKSVGGGDESRLKSRIVARLKKECEKCYRLDGGAKGRNLQIYVVGDKVIVRKLDDKDKDGFLYSPRGQEAYRESKNV